MSLVFRNSGSVGCLFRNPKINRDLYNYLLDPECEYIPLSTLLLNGSINAYYNLRMHYTGDNFVSSPEQVAKSIFGFSRNLKSNQVFRGTCYFECLYYTLRVMYGQVYIGSDLICEMFINKEFFENKTREAVVENIKNGNFLQYLVYWESSYESLRVMRNFDSESLKPIYRFNRMMRKICEKNNIPIVRERPIKPLRYFVNPLEEEKANTIKREYLNYYLKNESPSIS